jgi:hypothetical protein
MPLLQGTSVGLRYQLLISDSELPATSTAPRSRSPIQRLPGREADRLPTYSAEG